MNEPPIPSRDGVQLQLEGFDGPLDLLLELARRQKVDLARISITTLVDQYLQAVTGVERTDLIQAADWLVMAAWLTWLKSRLLLPTGPDDVGQAEQAQQVLTRRLVELERVRATADWLGSQPRLGWDMFERGHRERQKAVAPAATYVMLLEACVGVFRPGNARPGAAWQPRRVVEWTPHQAARRVEAMLDGRPRGGDLLEFVPPMPVGLPNREASLRTAIASTLVAALELARGERVQLRQDASFEPIGVRRAAQSAPPGGQDVGLPEQGPS